jgi:hypothetical protein
VGAADGDPETAGPDAAGDPVAGVSLDDPAPGWVVDRSVGAGLGASAAAGIAGTAKTAVKHRAASNPANERVIPGVIQRSSIGTTLGT